MRHTPGGCAAAASGRDAAPEAAARRVVVVSVPLGEAHARLLRGGGDPVRVELAKDCDFVRAGEMSLPEAYEGKVTGTARWQLPIKARGAGRDLRAVVWCQIPWVIVFASQLNVQLQSPSRYRVECNHTCMQKAASMLQERVECFENK